MPRLVCAAPVAYRAWALPRWFECLAAQTRRPGVVILLHSGTPRDDTWMTAEREAARHGFDLVLRHDGRQPHQRHDNERFRTLVDLRNRLRALALTEGAERYLSLDTDVMLTNPHTIQRLEQHVAGGADIASPATFLHPAASDPDVTEDIFWAYNAGWWPVGEGDVHDPHRGWLRPQPHEICWGTAMRIDIPMAVWLGNLKALSCRYEWHYSGEDLGFAQDLDERDLLVVWDTALRAEHIWCEQHMLARAAA